MSDLKLLLATAMVGTSRAALSPHVGTPLTGALDRVNRSDAESTLLARAALAGLASRAGRRLEPAPPPLEPAPAEILPEAPPRVTRHLPHLLRSPVLPEWLGLCAAAGWRVPHSFLPDVLDWGAAADAGGRAALRPVLGQRGRWLAGFSHDWRWMQRLERPGAAVPEEVWESATEAGREHLFHALRSASPATARAFLETHFRAERAGVRRRLLDVLTQTWEADDEQLEPLLEDTLLDRSEDVRDQARRLLQLWPDSAYNLRMAGRLRAMLGQAKVGLLGRLTGERTFTLTLPDAPDVNLKRDGLEDVGQPTQRLRRLLNCTHPATLMALLDLTPTGLVHLAAQFEAADELVRAVFASFSRSADGDSTELAELLLPHLHGDLRHWRAELLALAPPRRRVAELHKALRGHNAQLALDLLGTLPVPWPADLSGEVITQLHWALDRAESHYAAHDRRPNWDHVWMNVLELAQTCAAPDAPRPSPLPEDAPDYARQTLNTLYAALDFRAQMYADFAAERKE